MRRGGWAVWSAECHGSAVHLFLTTAACGEPTQTKVRRVPTPSSPWQAYLAEQGYFDSGEGLSGYFGAVTGEALQAWQRDQVRPLAVQLGMVAKRLDWQDSLPQ